LKRVLGELGNLVEDVYTHELQQEQAHFNMAREAYDASLTASDPKQWGVGTAAERRAMKKNFDSRAVLEAHEAVAFGRMDLDDGESYYVGKAPIKTENNDRLVISWKSPLATKYYQATAHDRQEVVRKRDYKTTRNHVDSFTDKVFEELAKQIQDLDDEIRTDDALLHSLAMTRTGQMQDIVRTIQSSQDKLMRAEKDQLLIIQGGPGTGKTAVALHRASWLLYNYRDELPADDMLVVGPNPAFTKYIQQVLPSLGDQRVRQTSVQEFLAGGLGVRGQESDAVGQVKGLSEMADVIAKGLDDRIKVPATALRIRRRNSGVTTSIMPETIAQDVQRLRSQPYGKGREALASRILEHCATAMGLRAGQSVADNMDPASVDAAVDRVWPRLSGAQFVRELLGSKQRLRVAAEGYLRADQVELLYRAPAPKIVDEPWTLADLALIDEAEDYMSGGSPLFGHIVVDEAQDLTPMQLFALRRRSRNGSMTLVGDIAQSTGAFARESWDDVAEALKSRLPCNVEELQHGYRVPKEVFDVAKPLLAIAAPNIKGPTIVRSVNADPELFDVPRPQLPAEVAKVASHHSGKGRFVGVVAPKELWEEVQTAFTAEDLKWSDSSAGQLGSSINLVTPEDSKGLEFDAVIVVDPAAILEQDNGARLLYIAVTRTTSRLDILAPTGSIPEVLRNAFPKLTVIDNSEASIDALQDDLLTETEKGEPAAEASPAGEDEDPPITVHLTDDELSPSEVLTPVEQELVRRNAEYLAGLVRQFYGGRYQKAVLEKALELLN
jgi:DNA helicase IV